MLWSTFVLIVAKDNNYDKIILGIDPGTNIAGYGIIGITKNDMSLISMGIFDLRKEKRGARAELHELTS
jgi:crossover junction endodeoxyribonuclease RuvC